MIPRYARPEAAAIWSPETRYRIWFEIEAHAADAMAELGTIPKSAAQAIWAKGRDAQFDPERIDEIERVTKHDVIAFLTHVSEIVGPEARFLHQGMTSSDVLDTCLAVQLSRAADLLIEDVDLVLAALKRRAFEHKYTPHLFDLGRLAEALADYDRAIVTDPNYAEAYANRGSLLLRLKRYEEAIESCDQALAIKADYADALGNRGSALRALQRLEEALENFSQALTLNPNAVELWNNHGNTLRDLGRHAAALECYDKALALRRDYPEALYNRANTLRDLGRREEALTWYGKALALRPSFAAALNNRGYVLRDLGRHKEAIRDFDAVLASCPDYEFMQGARLHAKMHYCDWRDFDNDLDHLLADLRADKPVIAPFALLALPVTQSERLRAAQTWVREKASPAPLPLSSIATSDRIRIAYLSADFYDHPTANLMAALFERHDRSRFEVTALSFGPAIQDAMRSRLENAFERFVDVRERGDREVALLLRDLGIDIAIDLKGYTQDARTGILALRPAPVQVSYLGYPGTMAAPYIDYILADRFVIPPEDRNFYTEKIAFLPDSYQVNDPARPIAEHTPTRREAGLPETGFVFCCFNNPYKIVPSQFDLWMRLLRGVEGSVLWLAAGPGERNLRREAEARGVRADRLVFAPHLPLAEHLARYRLADLFLDTLPYNAHTTASDALWVGLPVLTCPGDSFAGRVATGLLQAAGLPEMIVPSLEDYETLALKLAADPALLTGLKAKLAQNRATRPLFDIDRSRRHIEWAFTAMWERHRASALPDDFVVPDLTG